MVHFSMAASVLASDSDLLYSLAVIYLAADHRGFARKEEIKFFLDSLNLEYDDVGAATINPGDDEVDFVRLAAKEMTDSDKGIFICGSGVMVDIAANRFPHLRACLAFSPGEVQMARNDDNINVLCLAADFMSFEDTKKVIDVFLNTPFSGEDRFKRRLEKLAKITK